MALGVATPRRYLWSPFGAFALFCVAAATSVAAGSPLADQKNRAREAEARMVLSRWPTLGYNDPLYPYGISNGTEVSRGPVLARAQPYEEFIREYPETSAAGYAAQRLAGFYWSVFYDRATALQYARLAERDLGERAEARLIRLATEANPAAALRYFEHVIASDRRALSDNSGLLGYGLALPAADLYEIEALEYTTAIAVWRSYRAQLRSDSMTDRDHQPDADREIARLRILAAAHPPIIGYRTRVWLAPRRPGRGPDAPAYWPLGADDAAGWLVSPYQPKEARAEIISSLGVDGSANLYVLKRSYRPNYSGAWIVQKYSSRGRFVRVIHEIPIPDPNWGPRRRQPRRPMIAVSKSGAVAVLNDIERTITLIDRAGTIQRTIRLGRLEPKPSPCFALDDTGQVYVEDANHHKLFVFTNTGKRHRVRLPATLWERLRSSRYPTAVACAPAGAVCIQDSKGTVWAMRRGRLTKRVNLAPHPPTWRGDRVTGPFTGRLAVAPDGTIYTGRESRIYRRSPRGHIDLEVRALFPQRGVPEDSGHGDFVIARDGSIFALDGSTYPLILRLTPVKRGQRGVLAMPLNPRWRIIMGARNYITN